MSLSITTLDELRARTESWRNAGERIALVPTMGALHMGHLALVLTAKGQADKVVVSIFVNPTQFGPNEDLARYPRTPEEDLHLLEVAGVHAVWMPGVETMYPSGLSVDKDAGPLGAILEGAYRPGHFDGVLTVVDRLFQQVRPDIAIFGEKDFQQLFLIKRLASELEFPLRILGVPTLREDDGLAMSSRNQYLSPAEREIAPALYGTLQASAAALMMGEDIDSVLAAGKASLLGAGFRAIDYLELREQDTLDKVRRFGEVPSRLLAAAHLGTTRLIDNLRIG